MTHVEVGYNRRTWVTFKIKDATPEEIALLRQNEQGDYDEEVFTMLAEMEKRERLSVVEESNDDVPEYFHESVEPSIISVEEEME